jgi:hypothetical protein
LRETRLVTTSLREITKLSVREDKGADPFSEIRFEGRPLDIVEGGWRARAGAAQLEGLGRALLALRATSFEPPPAGELGLQISLEGAGGVVELAEQGGCGDAGVRVESSTLGAVCVAGAAWQELRRASLALSPRAWIESIPLAQPISELASAHGWTLVRRGGRFALVVGGTELVADDAAARALLTALSAPHALVDLDQGAVGTKAADAQYRDGTTVELTRVDTPRGPALARMGETIAMVGPGAAALNVTPNQLRDRTLWSEEPTSLARLLVGHAGKEIMIERGAVLGEWTGAKPQAVQGALPSLARLTVKGFIEEGPGSRASGLGPEPLELEATFDDPAGQASRVHRLSVGRSTARGCAASADDVAVELNEPFCRALWALAK